MPDLSTAEFLKLYPWRDDETLGRKPMDFLWKFSLPLLKRGDIERVITVGLVAHHLILFARDASSGQQNASYYSTRLRDMPVAAE